MPLHACLQPLKDAVGFHMHTAHCTDCPAGEWSCANSAGSCSPCACLAAHLKSLPDTSSVKGGASQTPLLHGAKRAAASLPAFVTERSQECIPWLPSWPASADCSAGCRYCRPKNVGPIHDDVQWALDLRSAPDAHAAVRRARGQDCRPPAAQLVRHGAPLHAGDVPLVRIHHLREPCRC